jgi:hypothetical protein
MMLRDIDYAATAVERSIVEKFGGRNDLTGLRVEAHERTISVVDGQRKGEGTRDDLLAAVRKASDYDELWRVVPGSGTSLGHS